MIDSVTYKKEIVRMWDDRRESHKGERNCLGVICEECPLDAACNSDDGPACTNSNYNAIEVVKIVEQWSKEHPFITNADKFKEVFGHEPTNFDGDYKCPSFALDKCPDGNDVCIECKKAYWKSEYKAPTESEKKE